MKVGDKVYYREPHFEGGNIEEIGDLRKELKL